MTDDFSVELQVTLQQGSLDNVKNQIKNIQTQPIKLQIDTAEAQNKVNNIKKSLTSIHTKPIQLQMNTTRVQNQLDNIRQQIQALGNITINLGGGNNNNGINNQFSAMQRAYRELYNLSKQISSMELKVGKLNMSGLNANNIAQYTAQLNALRTTYQTLMTSLSNPNVNLNSFFTQIDQSKTQIAGLSAVVDNARRSMATEIKLNINNGSLGSQIDTIEQKYNKLGTTNQLVVDRITQLRTLLSNIDASDNIESVTNDYQTYKQVLTDVTNQINILQQQQTASIANAKLANAKTAFSSEIDVWLRNNSAAAKTFGSQIQTIKSQIQSADSVSLGNLKAQFREVTQQARLAGEAGLSFADRLKAQMSKLGIYFSATMIIMQTVRAIKTGINTVVELDTSLLDLKKTSKATNAELTNFYYEANEQAKQLGVTTKEIIQSTSDWSRLGFNLNDSKTMAQVSSIFKTISPGMDIDSATSGLVSTMKAYNIAASDALDGIASKINAIGNSQALSNNDIVEFLTRSASAMASANNTLEETIALGTAATEVTRDAANVGQMLKTSSMRLRGYDEETQTYSEDVAVLTGKIADLTKTAKNPSGISLFTDETRQTYKSTYQIIKDISEIYDDLTDKQQAQLLEAIGGKRGGNVVAAMITNFQAAENSMVTMASSAGSAMKEMGIVEETLEYKLNALKQTGVGIFQNLFDRGDLGNAIELLTEVLSIIDKITESIGLLGTTITTIGVISFVTNFD